MTLSDLEAKFAGRTPGIMGVRDHYAVLVPLVERAGELYLLFELRASRMRQQPGEVCFPGGHMEAGETPVACALRETWEELGIPPDAISPIAELDGLCGRSNFLLHPILAAVDAGAARALTLNPDEVAECFFVPLQFFLDHPPEVYTYPLRPEVGDDFPYEKIGFPQGYHWRVGQMEVPIYRYRDRAIWGMTGRIVHGLCREDEG